MGRYLIAISYAICIVVIGQMLKGCDVSISDEAYSAAQMEITLRCFEKGTPVYKNGAYSHCATDCDLKWGEPG